MNRTCAIRSRVRLSVLRALALVLFGAGCGRERAGGDELLIASPHRDEIRSEIEQAFRGWYQRETGRDARPIWLDLGGASNIQKYITDRLQRAPSAGIDILFGGGTDPFETLKRQGNLLAYKLPDDLLNDIPPDLHGMPLYDPDHTWYGTVLSTFGIMYNRVVLRRMGMPEPRTWEDLGAPQYSARGAGWVGAADPRQSSSVHVIYENILQAYGWDKGFRVLIRLAANARGFERESAGVPRQVQIGEVACAPVIDFFAFSLIAREGRDTIGFVLPEGLTVITPDAVAIVRGAPHRPVAEAFLRFLLSEEGQKIWVLRHGVPGGPLRYDLGRPSILPRLYELPAEASAVTIHPFRMAAALRYDSGTASRRWNVLNDLIGAVLIDSHTELRDAWHDTLAVRDNADLLAELTRPPCAEATLAGLAESLRESPRERVRQIDAWLEAARRRYRGVADQASRRTAS